MAEVGQQVLLQDLQARADLNGQRAVVLQIGERLRCQVVRSGERVRVKPTCVVALGARRSVYASTYSSLQAVVDDVDPGTVIEVGTDYDEVVRITKPVSLIGVGTVFGRDVCKVRVAGVEIDVSSVDDDEGTDAVELIDLELGSSAMIERGCGLRVWDGSPIVARCTIRGMIGVRVDSFRIRSCPVLIGNCIEGRLGGIWWDGACWTIADPESPDATAGVPISPTGHGLPADVLDIVATNNFVGDILLVCSADTGVVALQRAGKFGPLLVAGEEHTAKSALAAEIEATGWYVHRPTDALMDRCHLQMERACWAQMASEPENIIRKAIWEQGASNSAEQLRQWRLTGRLGG